MWMLATCVDLQLAEHCPAELVLGHHTFDSHLNDSLWCFINQLFKTDRLDSTRLASVVIVSLVCGLITCDPDFFCINNNDVIASVYMWCVLGLVLTPQPVCDFCAESPQGFVRRIYHIPTVFYVFFSGAKCLHCLELLCLIY